MSWKYAHALSARCTPGSNFGKTWWHQTGHSMSWMPQKKIQCLVNDCWWCSEWQDQCPFHFWSNHYSSFISCWRLNDEVEANINQAHPNRWNWWKVPLLQLWKKMKKIVSSSLRLPCPCVPMVAEDIPGHLYECVNSGGILCGFRSAHTYFANLPQVWWLDPSVNPPVTLW